MRKDNAVQKGVLMLLIGLLLIASGAVTAQDTGDWRAYLLVGQTGQLMEIDGGGERARYTLDLPTNAFVAANQMRFSNDGARAAYCVFTSPTDTSELANYTLIVRDIPGQVNIIERDLGAIAGCTVSAFDTATNRVAVGVVNVFPDETVVAPDGPLWSLQLIDATTGAIVSELNDRTPGAPDGAALIPDFSGVVPIMSEVKVLNGSTVVFIAIPWIGRGGAFTLPAFAWNTESGTVGPADNAWGQFGNDFLPTMGELAYADSDPDLPAGNPSGPIAAMNVVRVLDATGSVTTVFHDPAWLVVEVKFVNGGQNLAIKLVESFDMASELPQQDYRAVLLSRDGTQTEMLRYPSYYWMEDVPGGFITLWSEVASVENPAPATLIDYFPVNGGGTRAWEFMPQDGQPIFWEIAWASPDTPQTGLPPFTAR